MRLSKVKINHLSHEVTRNLLASDAIDYKAEPNEIRLRIKAVIEGEMALDEEVDEAVRATIESYSKRRLHEGTREWEIEYARLYEEEIAKRRRG